MSQAAEVFALSIQDAENLLGHFNALNTKPPPPETEVLKRAGLIMAMTAWETYRRGQHPAGGREATGRAERCLDRGLCPHPIGRRDRAAARPGLR